MFSSGITGAIARCCCGAAKVGGGNYTMWQYPCSQNDFAFQKCGRSRWPVITVHCSQRRVITVRLNRKIDTFDALGQVGWPDTDKRDSCANAASQDNCSKLWAKIYCLDDVSWIIYIHMPWFIIKILILTGGYFRYLSNSTHWRQTILHRLVLEYIFRPHDLSVEYSNVLRLSYTHFHFSHIQIGWQYFYFENKMKL